MTDNTTPGGENPFGQPGPETGRDIASNGSAGLPGGAPGNPGVAGAPFEDSGLPDSEFTDYAFDTMAEHDPDAADALRAEWGGDAAQQLVYAHAAMDEFTTPDLLDALEDSGLGNHPSIIRAAAAIGRRLVEEGAGGHSTNARHSQASAGAERIQDQIDAIMAEHWGKPSYTSRRVQRRLDGLYARLPGTGEPIVDGTRRVR